MEEIRQSTWQVENNMGQIVLVEFLVGRVVFGPSCPDGHLLSFDYKL